MLAPGSTIGILGGGQLGRMLAVAAAQLGYRTHVLAPEADSVAAQTAASLTRADYHNRIVLADFAAAIPGRCAAPPAPAITTFSPRPAAPFA